MGNILLQQNEKACVKRNKCYNRYICFQSFAVGISLFFIFIATLVFASTMMHYAIKVDHCIAEAQNEGRTITHCKDETLIKDNLIALNSTSITSQMDLSLKIGLGYIAAAKLMIGEPFKTEFTAGAQKIFLIYVVESFGAYILTSAGIILYTVALSITYFEVHTTEFQAGVASIVSNDMLIYAFLILGSNVMKRYKDAIKLTETGKGSEDDPKKNI